MRTGTLIQVILIGTLCAQDSTRSPISEAKWSSTLGLTLSPDWRVNTTISYQFPDEIELASIRIRPHLTVGMHQDLWQTEYEEVGIIHYRKNYYYDLVYVMLEGCTPIRDTRELDLHVTAGGGLGLYDLWGYGSSRFGSSYIVSTGLRARFWKIIVETRIIHHNEYQRPVYTFNLGYQSQNALGSFALPLLGAIFGILLNLSVGGGGFGPGQF